MVRALSISGLLNASESRLGNSRWTAATTGRAPITAMVELSRMACTSASSTVIFLPHCLESAAASDAEPLRAMASTVACPIGGNTTWSAPMRATCSIRKSFNSAL